MRATTILFAGTTLVLLTACEGAPASGPGADVVDEAASDNASSDDASEADETSDNDEASGDDEAETDGDAAVGTRENPLELGTTIEMGDWTVTVTDVTLDATDTVLAENQFNESPVDGRQFVMFNVDATYEGDDSGTAWVDLSWAVVGADGNTFGTSTDDYCGVIPDSLQDTGETFPGGEVSGNVCVSVESDQIDGATIRVDDSFSMEDSRAFFALG